MPSDVRVHDGGVDITSGLYDTDDGITLQVQGDSFPRVHITPQGSVRVGSGGDSPSDVGTPGEWVVIGSEGAPAFQNSWQWVDIALSTTTGQARPQYRVLNGQVEVIAAVYGGAPNSIAWTMPEGLRPPYNVSTGLNGVTDFTNTGFAGGSMNQDGSVFVSGGFLFDSTGLVVAPTGSTTLVILHFSYPIA